MLRLLFLCIAIVLALVVPGNRASAQSLLPADSSTPGSRAHLEFGVLVGSTNTLLAAGGYIVVSHGKIEIELNAEHAPPISQSSTASYPQIVSTRCAMTSSWVVVNPIVDLSIGFGPAITWSAEGVTLEGYAIKPVGSFLGSPLYEIDFTPHLGGTMVAALKFHFSKHSQFRVQGSVTADKGGRYGTLVGTLGYRF